MKWLQERGWHAYVDRPSQVVFLATPWGILSLAGPAYPQLFSERHRRGVSVLPLWGSWRIRWRHPRVWPNPKGGEQMTVRPKHYSRPGKRPGPPRSPTQGGSVIDQRGRADLRDQMAQGLRYCSYCDASRWENRCPDCGGVTR